MAKITVLDQNTINQIAAGEVIERPAAVVKELVENSIDAGANAVTVEIKEGGISFIRITDNGSGIDEEDMPLVFLRHSTSKIKTAQDLLRVSSLGFRGEALSSVAAIAQVELVTKTSDSFSGIRYLIAGGEETSMEHIGCPNGTTFIIRNLFFNTPARRKFLKSPTTEAGYISDVMERLAVSHPNISFKFIVNNQIKLHTSGNNNLKDIIYNVYGRDISAQLISVHGEDRQMSVNGFIAKPIVSRGNRNYENYYINGRYIKSNIINKAIEEAFRPFIMSHRYPFTSLHLKIDSELIDVNVHPAKLEIRFKNGEEIYQFIYHAIKNTLEGKEMIPSVKLTEHKEQVKPEKNVPEPFETNRRQEVSSLQKNQKIRPFQTGSQNHGNYLTQSKDSDNDKKDHDTSKKDHDTDKKDHDTDKKDSTTVLNYNVAEEKNDPTKESRFNHSNIDILNQVKETEIGKLHNVVTTAPVLMKEAQEYTYHQKEDTKNPSFIEHTNESEKSSLESNLNGKDSINTNLDTKNIEKPEEESLKQTQDPNAHMIKSHQTDLCKTERNNKIDDNETSAKADKPEQLSFLSEEAIINHRIIGQVFSTYWIVEYGDKMFLIDQHAAHEKVLYEKMIHALKEKQFHSQMIEPPIILTLSIREEEAMKRHMEILEKIGFEIEEFGGKEYAVRAVPSDLYGLAQNEILVELIDELVDEVYNETPEMILEKVASMSCKAAVKGNHKLSFQEASALIDQLLVLDNPYNCPHGRPVIISMSKYELEKKFKRII